MTGPSAPPAGLARRDWERLAAMLRFVTGQSTAGALRVLAPGCARAGGGDVLLRHTRLDHGGVLVFPERVEEALAGLARRGITAGAPIPSTVVRSRLLARYDLPADLPLAVAQARVAGRPGPGLELFLLPSGARGARPLMADERAHQHEAHLAFRVTEPDEDILRDVWAAVTGAADLAADGGGYNPHQGPDGCTVLYFRGAGRLPRPYGWSRRLEIITGGRHERVLGRHLDG